ncbi:F0F1 ATP synthase subunit epsilon [Brachyspira catarrhinii]|uniref:ATP synthase epsilon chain n=1 Tax=Brachyspira catarrhinii TaxID=2528966 RepID=A0ABY2TP66_9SPIR|nr:F0F1 ATP synthase subunit epsilon [Brachyspira catarrhinii]TKZ31732.1 F0F1 ATP synthase subunit epsilon [Brachyspira catarrhinii]
MATNIKTKKALTCSVLTKEGPVIRTMKIEHIEIPSYAGYVSIYSDHCPYIVSVRYGELKIYDESGKLINLYIEGGIAEVSQNIIGVLTEKAIYPKDIDIEATKEKIEKIKNQATINEEEAKRNREEIEKYKKQIEIASK